MWIRENQFPRNFLKLVTRQNLFPRNFSRINEIRILEFLFETVSLELGLLVTIGYFVIRLSKKSIDFY